MADYPFLGDEGRAAELAGTDIPTIYQWMEAAHAVVTARLAGAGLSDAVLGMIEEHLAAHYHETGGGGGSGAVASERLGSWSVTYAAAGQAVSNLMATRNGRIAIELDTSGRLGEASKPKSTFAVL